MIGADDQIKTDANMHFFRLSLACLGFIGLSAHAQDRLPTVPPAQYSAEQKQAAADFEAARKDG